MTAEQEISYDGPQPCKYISRGIISVDKRAIVTVQILINGLVRGVWNKGFMEPNTQAEFYVSAIVHNGETIEMSTKYHNPELRVQPIGTKITIHQRTSELVNNIYDPFEDLREFSYWNRIFNKTKEGENDESNGKEAV